MTDAYQCRLARRSDIPLLAPILSEGFSVSARAIFPRGHTQDSIAYREAELQQWYLEAATEQGEGNAGTDRGQRRLMVVCLKEDENTPVGFCQYELVEAGMKHASTTARVDQWPPFPAGADKEQYYLWKDMIYETRRAIFADRRHANVPSMVVSASLRGNKNFARRAISDFCAVHYREWSDPPVYNDAYPKAAPLWIRTGFHYVDFPLNTPFKYATNERTNSTREVALRRGQDPEAVPEEQCYVTIPQIRWSVNDRDAGDRMAPSGPGSAQSQQRKGQMQSSQEQRHQQQPQQQSQGAHQKQHRQNAKAKL